MSMRRQGLSDTQGLIGSFKDKISQVLFADKNIKDDNLLVGLLVCYTYSLQIGVNYAQINKLTNMDNDSVISDRLIILLVDTTLLSVTCQNCKSSGISSPTIFVHSGWTDNSTIATDVCFHKLWHQVYHNNIGVLSYRTQ